MSEHPEWDAQLGLGGDSTPVAQPESPTTAAPAESISVEVPVEAAPEPTEGGAQAAAPQLTSDPIPQELADLVPENLRGATLAETLRNVAEDRKKAWAERHKAGFDANRMAELEQMVQSLNQRLVRPQPQPAPPVPQPTFAEQLRQRGVNPDTDLIDRAPDVLGATAEYAVQQAQRQIGETLQQYEARVRQLEQIQIANQAERAFQTARPQTIAPEEWNAKAYAIASFIKGNGWESRIGDPNVHAAAYRMLYGEPPAPQAAPVSAPAARPAAPPVGAKPATAAAPAPKRQFSEKYRSEYKAIADAMGIKDFGAWEQEYIASREGKR